MIVRQTMIYLNYRAVNCHLELPTVLMPLPNRIHNARIYQREILILKSFAPVTDGMNLQLEFVRKTI